jgi:hypothetical protein
MRIQRKIVPVSQINDCLHVLDRFLVGVLLVGYPADDIKSHIDCFLKTIKFRLVTIVQRGTWKSNKLNVDQFFVLLSKIN